MKKLTLILIALILLTACQPTPEDEIVIQRSDADGETGGEIVPPPEFPATIQGTASFEADGVPTELVVDAEVKTYDSAGYFRCPIEIVPYSNEVKKSFVSACVSDAEVFSDSPSRGVTRDMLNRQLEFYVSLLDESNPRWEYLFEVREEKDPEALMDYGKGEIELSIQRVQERLLTATEQIEGTRADLDNLSSPAELCADTGNMYPALIWLTPQDNNTETYALMSGATGGNPSFAINSQIMELYNSYDISIDISMDDARAVADEFVSKINGVNLIFAGEGKDYIYDFSYPFNEWGASATYVFVYVPQVNGVPLNYVDIEYLMEQTRWELRFPEGMVNSPVYQNYLYVFVNDYGINCVSWRHAAEYRIIEESKTAVSLLSFDEVMEIFYRHIEYGTNFCSTNSSKLSKSSRQTLEIDQITLGYALVRSGTGANDFELIPVWDFYGRMHEVYDNPGQIMTEEDGTRYETTLGRSYLTINAIDGTIIDRVRGY
ncbi:MAG: DUF6034 family protein [Clostridia bacterium]|nr:DUF6034 family protein [Clostridia bacterium]